MLETARENEDQKIYYHLESWVHHFVISRPDLAKIGISSLAE